MFNQGERNGKPLLEECCVVHPKDYRSLRDSTDSSSSSTVGRNPV